MFSLTPPERSRVPGEQASKQKQYIFEAINTEEKVNQFQLTKHELSFCFLKPLFLCVRACVCLCLCFLSAQLLWLQPIQQQLVLFRERERERKEARERWVPRLKEKPAMVEEVLLCFACVYASFGFEKIMMNF